MSETAVYTGSVANRSNETDETLRDGVGAQDRFYVRPARLRTDSVSEPSSATRNQNTKRSPVTNSPIPTATTVSPHSRFEKIISAPAVVPRSKPRTSNFTALQTWEGVVDEVFSTYFRARLVDVRSGAEEFADLEFAEVSQPDLNLVKEGAFFYWSIGYERRSTGQTLKVSLLRFRRVRTLPREGNKVVDSMWQEGVEEAWLSAE